MGDQNLLGFSVVIGIDLVLCVGFENDLVLVFRFSTGIEIDLFFVQGSELICFFLCVGSKMTSF